MVRAWHADRWLRALHSCFAAGDIAAARPDLWASDDPSAELPAETETGNANLSAFVSHGYLENGEPRRYDDLKRLNDGLRERGRRALIAYLCHMNRVALPWQPGQFATGPGDLSDLLLLDVEAGLCERASRIEEAITAVQSFVRRSRLGLEPGWTVTSEFARLWDSRFENYRTWERCRRRELYRENWIEWDELREARRIEAFRFLESQLRSSTLSLAAPGGLDWWADDDADLEQAPELLQRRVPAQLHQLSPLPKSASREGLATLGTPEYAAQPTWLAAVPQVSSDTDTPPPDGDGADAPGGSCRRGWRRRRSGAARRWGRRRGRRRGRRGARPSPGAGAGRGRRHVFTGAAALDGGGHQAGNTFRARGGGRNPRGRGRVRPARDGGPPGVLP